MAREVTARFAGRCRCGSLVKYGDRIHWDSRLGIVGCPGCRGDDPENRFDQQVEDNMAAASGVGENDPGRR